MQEPTDPKPKPCFPGIVRQIGAHRMEARVTFGYIKKGGVYTEVQGGLFTVGD